MMNIEQITEKAIQCIRRGKSLSVSAEELIRQDDLTALGFDSIELMHNIINLEEDFGISFTETDLAYENVNSFTRLCSLIYGCLQENT